MTGIFDTKNGARGWIAGPFICLWFSAFDRYGPMLFGLISANNLGTRVHGRAGSDLNGVLMFTLLIPLMAWLVFKVVSEGQASGGQLVVTALVFWWAAHSYIGRHIRSGRMPNRLSGFYGRRWPDRMPVPNRR